jgi:hypothetical protein
MTNLKPFGMRTLAIIAIATAGLTLSGCSMFNRAFGSSDDVDTIDYVDLKVGDCLRDFDNDDPSSIPSVSCSKMHDSEVYAVIPLGDGKYPGDLKIFRDAKFGCIEQFDAFVGTSYIESELEYTYYGPDEFSWRDGDHAIRCAVWSLGGSRHSLKNSQR